MAGLDKAGLYLLDEISAAGGRLARHRAHYNGSAPMAFLSPESQKSLDGRLQKLSVNIPRLVVGSLVDRLTLTGFKTPGEDGAMVDDAALRAVLRRVNFLMHSELVHTDRLTYGAAFVTVWGHRSASKQAVMITDSPLTMAADVDPTTGEVRAALRTWQARGNSFAAQIGPRETRIYRANGTDAAASSYELLTTNPNGLGVVPVVPMVRRADTGDHRGTSAITDILDITDALAKILQDAMVTSEDYARPRRFATGLEIEFDDDGHAIDPFGKGRNLQSEAPETKFGQFDGARLDGYGDMVATLTQQAGALSGLPPHYLGLHGDQPANADGVKAAEVQLTSRALSEQRQLSRPWERVAALLMAITTGRDVDTFDYSAVWGSPEIRTPAQAADAAVKLQTLGIPLESLLADPLGYEPEQIRAIMDGQRGEQILRAGLDLSKVIA